MHMHSMFLYLANSSPPPRGHGHGCGQGQPYQSRPTIYMDVSILRIYINILLHSMGILQDEVIII